MKNLFLIIACAILCAACGKAPDKFADVLPDVRELAVERNMTLSSVDTVTLPMQSITSLNYVVAVTSSEWTTELASIRNRAARKEHIEKGRAQCAEWRKLLDQYSSEYYNPLPPEGLGMDYQRVTVTDGSHTECYYTKVGENSLSKLATFEFLSEWHKVLTSIYNFEVKVIMSN